MGNNGQLSGKQANFQFEKYLTAIEQKSYVQAYSALRAAPKELVGKLLVYLAWAKPNGYRPAMATLRYTPDAATALRAVTVILISLG